MNIDDVINKYITTYQDNTRNLTFDFKNKDIKEVGKIGYYYFKVSDNDKFNEVLSYLDELNHIKKIESSYYPFLNGIKYWLESNLIVADEYFNEALELQNSDNKYLHLELFFFLQEQGDDVMAYKHLNEALKVDPNYSEALSTLASTLDPIDNCQDIIVILDKVSSNYKDPFVYYWKGTALVNCGDTKSALIEFNKSLDIEKTPEAFYGLALVYSDYLNDSSKAKTFFEMCISLDGNNIHYLNSYAWFLHDISEENKAKEYFKKVLSINTEIEAYAQYIEFLIIIELYEEADNKIIDCVKLNGENFITDGLKILLESKKGLNCEGLTNKFKNNYDDFELDWLKSLMLRHIN